MAGRAPDERARYRRAWEAGNRGSKLPQGLADLADSDPGIDEAYQHGQGNEPFDQWWETRTSRRPSPTRPQPSRPRRSSSSPGPVRRYAAGQARQAGSRVSSGANDLAGAFLGMLVYAIVLSVVDYGSAGPGMWFKAKFLNQTGSSSTTTKPAATTAPSGSVPSVVLA